MPKRRGEAKGAKRTRTEQEAAEGLTFLEKLVARALPTRAVPKESGVHFAIASQANKDGICLVFEVDDKKAPIFEAGSVRPDYLVVHASRSACILTIVEMKGCDGKKLEDGVEQIRLMYRRLRAELSRCIPGSWRKAIIQGVLLTPENAQINPKKIDEASKEGIEIFPLRYHHQAELYPYVSARIDRTRPYKHERLRRDPPELNPVERLIAEGKLDWRVRDAFFAERHGADEDTFFMSFRRAGDPKEARVSLSATTRDAVLAFSPAATSARREVEGHLKKHGLACRAFRLHPAT